MGPEHGRCSIVKWCAPTMRRLLPLTATLVLLAGLLGAPGALGRAASPGAHAASSFLTGIGDEHPQMFGDPLWTQLHTPIARYIAPYDAAVRPYDLAKAATWIHAAEAQHQQILIAFYHSEYTPTRLPSVATYAGDVQKFIKLFPNVTQYEAYDEANRGNVRGAFASPSATLDAQYYQALLRACTGCTVIGLDILDAHVVSPSLRYVSAFKNAVRHLKTRMPSVWGLHNYADVNRLQSSRTRQLVHALGGQVWLTETGGIVHLGSEFPNRRGSGLKRAARVLKYLFSLARSEPAIKRLYIFSWIGGAGSARFDAGLMDALGKPRPGYVAVCRALHAANCSVRVSAH
jgi:hypothetical protein